MAAPRGPGPATPGPLPPGPSGLAWSWLLSTLLLLFPLSLSNSCSSSPHLLERFLHPSLPPHPFSGPARQPPGLSNRCCQSPPSHCCVLLVVPPERSSRSKTFNGSQGHRRTRRLLTTGRLRHPVPASCPVQSLPPPVAPCSLPLFCCPPRRGSPTRLLISGVWCSSPSTNSLLTSLPGHRWLSLFSRPREEPVPG